MMSHKRGRLFVDRDVQRALLWQLLRHWALFIGMLMGMLLAIEALGSVGPRTMSEHLGTLWSRHIPLFVTIAALFPVFAYDSIRLSNRFVGPMLRVRQALRDAAQGAPARPLQFRQDDFWHDLAESFNLLLQRLKTEQLRTAAEPYKDSADGESDLVAAGAASTTAEEA